MSVTKEHFGEMPDGREVSLYTIKNKNGLKISPFHVFFLIPAPSYSQRTALLFLLLIGALTNSCKP